MSQNKEDVWVWNLTNIVSLGLFSIPLILFFIFFLYNLDTTFPSFEDLSIKRGVLEHFEEKGEKEDIWITLLIDGKRENIRIPRRPQISQLRNETGKIIEVNEQRRRAIGSIKIVSKAKKEEAQVKFWENAEVGKVYRGEVKSVTTSHLDSNKYENDANENFTSNKPPTSSSLFLSLPQPVRYLR